MYNGMHMIIFIYVYKYVSYTSIHSFLVRRSPLPLGLVNGVGGVGEQRMDWRSE